ncbi:hypothetical protein Tco_1376132 [Tanacetum coccineum]
MAGQNTPRPNHDMGSAHNISLDDSVKLDQFAQFRFNSLTDDEAWNRIEEYVQYQDDSWEDTLPFMDVSSISEAIQPTFRGRLKLASKQISHLETATRDIGGNIYDDPSLLKFYQNENIQPWGNNKREEKGEDGPEWVVRNKFEDELANFMLEKKLHKKGIGEMLDQHHKEMHEQFSQILSTIGEENFPET